jgi:hypothetical protein
MALPPPEERKGLLAGRLGATSDREGDTHQNDERRGANL